VATVESVQGEIGPVYDEVADFLASSPTLEQIVTFRLSEASERVISDLLDANRTRGLTPAERLALDDYARIERLMQAIKVRAYARLA